MQKAKVLLLGTIEGSYRSQYIIKYLADRNYDFYFVYLGKWGPISVEGIIFKTFSYLIRKLYEFLYCLFLPGATHVFMLPLNEKFDHVFKLAKLLGKRTIVDFYSSRDYGMNLQLGQNALPPKRIRRLRNFDLNVIKYADELLFLNKADAEYYLNQLGLSGEMVDYKIVPLATPLRQKAKLNGFKQPKNGFNLCWWGKAANVHGVDIMLEALKLIRDQSYQFHVYLMDTDPNRAKILDESLINYGLQDVATVRFDLSFSDGLEEFLVENCDIALGSFGTSNLAKIGLSNKIVDAMSMGIPMISVNTEAIGEFGLEDTIVTVCDPDPSIICEKLMELMVNPIDVDSYQAFAMDTHYKMFSAERFYKYLDELFS